jgi:hypothetical protein
MNANLNKGLESPSQSVALLSLRVTEPISVSFRISARTVTSLPELCLGSIFNIYIYLKGLMLLVSHYDIAKGM